MRASSISAVNGWHSKIWFACEVALGNHGAAFMNHNDGIAGKVAFITGGGAGIGRAIALQWLARGGVAAVTDLDGAAATNALAAAGASVDRGSSQALDVRDGAAIRAAIALAAARHGGVDALFNVAGVNLPKNVEEIDELDWQRLLDTNLNSVFHCSRAVIPLLRARGGGVIVNIASIAGVMGENRCSAYSATKGAVINLTRNMAMDFARDNIRVNAVSPGGTLTPRIESYMANEPQNRREMEEMCPLRRMARPEEIAAPAVFLASAGASYITGANLVVDGGLTAGFRVAAFDRM